MIARIWTARTNAARERDYLETVRQHVLPRLRSVAGYSGATFLRRETQQGVEYLVVTLWESMDAVRALVGADTGIAHVPPEIQATLERYDERAQHFEVALQDKDGAD